MRSVRLVTATLALLILSLALSACDGSVSIDSLTGIQAQGSSPGSDKQIKAPFDSIGDQSAEGSADISNNFEVRSNSKLIADSPEVSDSGELHLYCEITAVTETTLTACDITYEVDTTDDLTTMFTVGEFYEIEYLLNDNSTITIVKFELENSTDDNLDDEELHLYCEITEVIENTFTACGETYEVDTTDDLTTLLIVGEFYEIEYVLNDDGTITLVKFELEDDLGDDMDDDLDDDDEHSSNDNDHNNDNNDDNNNNNYDDNDNNNNNNNEDNDDSEIND